MLARHALCIGADLAICDGCRRLVDYNPAAANNPHQPYVAPTRSNRCVNWLARPAHAITPTDTRN